MTTALEWGRAYWNAGLSVIPIRGDGSKEPELPAGDDVLNRRRRATLVEIESWLSGPWQGVGVLGGPVSGGLEVIDFDRADLFPPWSAMIQVEAPGLVERLTINKTPNGWHVAYRCPDHIEGNLKLARELDPAAPPDKPRPRNLIETRGSGGYVLAPGCPSCCHDSGRPYLHHSGPSLANVSTITEAERDLLIECAARFNTWTPPERPVPPRPSSAAVGDRPGDVFNARGGWPEAFGASGWRYCRPTGGLDGWTRPGKARGISATTGLRSDCGKDLLVVFSTNAYPLEAEHSYSKFAVYTLLQHNGDWAAAARALAALGYGEPSRSTGRILYPDPSVPTLPPNGQAAPVPPTRLQQILGAQSMTVEMYRHDDLLDADLPPLRWVVDGLIPDEGFTLLGGKKKLGKSWFCLQAAQAIATGADCLGRSVAPGRVVYICLEDGKRRLRQRLICAHAHRGLDVIYVFRFPKLDNSEGMGRLLDLIEEQSPRLLIIDTLAAAKSGKTEENAAGPMADLGNALRAVAQHYRLGLLATHHHGKLTGGDPGDDLRGSSALAAAADVNLGLYRGEGGYTFKGEGRDMDNLSLPVSFDAHGSWEWTTGQANPPVDSAEADVLQAVSVLGEADVDLVAECACVSKSTASKHLRNLAQRGVVLNRAVPTGQRGRERILYRLHETTSGRNGEASH